MSTVPPDYDSDPGRAASWDPSWVVAPEGDDGDATAAGRIIAERLAPVLDVGCGTGSFAAELPAEARWIGVDASATQLAGATTRPVFRADARALPFRDQTCGAVVCNWMLYHFDEPTVAIAEAYRVLRPGGLFLASTSSRAQDPELAPDGYPPSTFDAEEAPAIVGSVFGSEAVEVDAWDGPYVVLPDRAAVAAYVRHHGLPAERADSARTPLTLTKRGCFVWARRLAG